MTGWVERDAINKTNCESRVIYVCVSIWNRLAIAFVIALSQLSLSLLLRQTVCIFCNATGKCVAVLCLCMFRRQNHVSAGEWRRYASNSRRTFALMLSGGILEAVDLEFKLLNNNNTCSHLAFIVLLFSFRHFVHCFCDLLLLLFHHHNKSLLAVWELMCHRFIWFHFFSLFRIRAIFFIDLDLMGYQAKT